MPVKQVIVVRKDLNMRKGKLAAQVAHAAMKFLLDAKHPELHPEGETVGFSLVTKGPILEAPLSKVQAEWLQGSFTKVVVSINSESELLELIERGKSAGLTVSPIQDNGLTEFHGVKTLTCAAFGPDEAEKLDAITGGLPLL